VPPPEMLRAAAEEYHSPAGHHRVAVAAGFA
jgi:hypothetical protein